MVERHSQFEKYFLACYWALVETMFNHRTPRNSVIVSAYHELILLDHYISRVVRLSGHRKSDENNHLGVMNKLQRQMSQTLTSPTNAAYSMAS